MISPSSRPIAVPPSETEAAQVCANARLQKPGQFANRTSLAENAARIRFVAALVGPLFVVGMIAWFMPFDDLLDRSGTPLGGDYLMLYIAGQTVRDGQSSHLYDDAAQVVRMLTVIPGIDPDTCRLPYRYPPLTGLLMAPLAMLPFGGSFLVFTLASSAAGICAVRTLVKVAFDTDAAGSEPRSRWLRPALYWIGSWPVVLETLAGGQLTLFGLAILALGLLQLKQGNPIRAGLILALAAYKPNLMALLILGIVVRYPRAAIGIALGSASLVALQAALAGWSSLTAYAQLGARLALQTWSLETPYWKVHGLAGWVQKLLPGYERPLLLLTGAAGSIAVAWFWRRRPAAPTFAPAVSCLLLINAICNPYLPIYDLALLAAIPCLLAGTAAGLKFDHLPGAAPFVLAAAYFGPHLSQAFAPMVGLQLLPGLLIVILLYLLRNPVPNSTQRCYPAGKADRGRHDRHLSTSIDS